MKRLLIIIACLTLAVSAARAQLDPNAVAEPTRQQEDTPEGLLIIEAETFDNQVLKDQSNWLVVSDSAASRGQAMASEDSGINYNQDDYAEVSPRLDYRCTFVKSGTHYVWLRMRYFAGDADTAHLGLDGAGDPGSRRIDAPDSAEGAWQWSNFKQNPDGTAMIEIPSPGERTVNLWVREDGVQVDKIILTTDPNYVPSTYGPRDPSLGPAVTLEPTTAVVATGDNGMALSIANVDVNDLILGTTTFAGEPKHADFPPAAADNFDLSTGASADDQDWVQTIFDLPVTTVFIIEKGGNDSGYMVILDENGQAIDDPVPFSPADFADTGLKGVQGQKVAATIVTPETPIYGIRILAPDGAALGFDPTSVSGVPGTIITAGPIESLDALTAADLDPDAGDANTLVEVLAINGNGVSGLILGTTSSDFEKFADHPAAHADNFDLTTYASLDESNVVEVVFDIAVTTVFILERGANDQGYLLPIDADGDPIGGVLKFTQSDFQFQDEGLKIVNQAAGGMAIEAKVPINGLLIVPLEGDTLGIDPASISGIPVPVITAGPLDSLVVDDPDDEDPETPIVVTAINGISTDDLVLGITAANPDNQERADNFNVDADSDYARRDPDNFVTTMFDVPVRQIFVLEKDGNDGGWLQPLDADGLPVGGRLDFASSVFSQTDTSQWTVGGMVITADVPVYGIRIWSTGIDVQSVSAVPE